MLPDSITYLFTRGFRSEKGMSLFEEWPSLASLAADSAASGETDRSRVSQNLVVFTSDGKG